jgi:UDP-glucose 4-epimerase
MAALTGRRVLITGGAGFIGSHLVRRLVGLGADVAVVTKYNSVVDNVRLVDLWHRVRVIEADIRNLDSLRQLRELRPEVVYHLAAYNHVGDSFLHVNEALDSNAKGTANVLESCEGYERFVYISTSEVYGSQASVPFVETMTPNPISPYAVGKYAGELYCRMQMHMRDRRVVVLRPFNAFGPYQSPRAVIAELILTFLAGHPVRTTEGRQTRDFNFVGNLVNGFVLAGECEEAIGQIINLGSGVEIAIRDLVRAVQGECRSRSAVEIGALPYRPTEIWRMVADRAVAERVLGWRPKVDFAEGLRRTVAWYRDFVREFEDAGSALGRLSAGSE